MVTKQEIKDVLGDCKDSLVVHLWNKCANEHNYEEIFKNDKWFFYAHRDFWNAFDAAEMVYNGDFRVVDAYIYIDGCDHLVTFNRPWDELSPIDYDVLASFIHERYDLIMPCDLFYIEINNKED